MESDVILVDRQPSFDDSSYRRSMGLYYDMAVTLLAYGAPGDGLFPHAQ